MRRLTPLLLVAGLSGCTGFGEFVDHTFTRPGRNPNVPMADSENVRRVRGLTPALQPLEVEPGNIWPKFERQPTLEDIANNTARENARGFPPTVVPGAEPGLPASHQPRPVRGSSTPPDQSQPGIKTVPAPSTVPPPPTANAPKTLGGSVLQTPEGPAVDTGGTNSYRMYNLPGSPGAIVVPNGNGTSTVIQPNGTIQTVPSPR